MVIYYIFSLCSCSWLVNILLGMKAINSGTQLAITVVFYVSYINGVFSKDLSSKAVIYYTLRECYLWFIMSRVKTVHRNSENLRSAMWGEGSFEEWQREREEIGIAM